MNFGAGGLPGGMAGGMPSGPSQVDMARAEMMFFADLFTKMNDACFRKCVPRFNDGQLNTGEMVCVDKCVAKYMEVRSRCEVRAMGVKMAEVGSRWWLVSWRIY